MYSMCTHLFTRTEDLCFRSQLVWQLNTYTHTVRWHGNWNFIHKSMSISTQNRYLMELIAFKRRHNMRYAFAYGFNKIASEICAHDIVCLSKQSGKCCTEKKYQSRHEMKKQSRAHENLPQQWRVQKQKKTKRESATMDMRMHLKCSHCIHFDQDNL